MGLFSEYKQCRKGDECTCGGGPKATNAAATASSSRQMPSPGRVIGGGRIKQSGGEAATHQATSRPIDPAEYVKYVQKSVSGASPVVIRGLVNKHLEMDPYMSLQTMLKKVRAQLKQI